MALPGTTPVSAYIAIGANVAPERNIPRALERLAQATTLHALSTFYITAPIGRPEQDDYLNGVAAVACSCSARALKFDILRRIETELGRTRTPDRYAPRTIDLDLALFGDLVCREPGLCVPDAELRERPFLLTALFEVAPGLVLPDTGESLQDLLAATDPGPLRRAEPFSRQLRERLGL